MIAAASLVALALASGAPAAAGAPEPDARERAWFTDTVLVSQDQAPLRFYTDVLKDRLVVIDFIFTRCIGACPVLTSKLVQLRSQLGELYGSRVRFVSISVDPEFDTPAEMKAFAAKHRADDAGWLWLTGPRADVDAVLRRLGGWVENPEEHSTLFLVGNVSKRHWTKVQSTLPATAIAEQVRRLLAK